jgi:hypothetical protein
MLARSFLEPREKQKNMNLVKLHFEAEEGTNIEPFGDIFSGREEQQISFEMTVEQDTEGDI